MKRKHLATVGGLGAWAFLAAAVVAISAVSSGTGPLTAASAHTKTTRTTSPTTTATSASTTSTSTASTSTTSTSSSTSTQSATTTTTSASTTPTFVTGQLQATTVGAGGCATNGDGEPQVHISRANNLFLGSERGLGGGSDGWRQVPAAAGAGASACSPLYAGQPNAVSGVGASGGDLDLAWGSATISSGNYPLYVASLNLGSVAVATSTDNGATFTNMPVQAGLPGDDREWIAAYGATTSLLTFHDITTNEIDVLRSDNTGAVYTEIAQAIPLTGTYGYAATNNEIGNIVIDHNNTAGTTTGPGGQAGFWAYQSFVAPSTSTGPTLNEAFLAVSNNGGYTWTDQPIPCSMNDVNGATNGLNHMFPNVSVDPAGNIWYDWSDDTNIYVARSTDHGSTWTCSGRVSTDTTQAVMPWLVATSAGVDLVYYGTPTPAGQTQTWYVYFVQDVADTITGFGSPQQLTAVHRGTVCEQGATCTSGRQLLDDFGIETDQNGYAHIAYSADGPSLGGSSTYTGYAVQTGGSVVGRPN